ncbi:MAG: endonuclease domain-containing protein [Clostridia bacterium]|nr:endonuclease domain-containing protein [Clostridia bacterium]
MSLEYNKNNIVLAKNLRKNATRQEKHLWYDFLSKYSVRFQRQKAIGNYIVDFFCHKAKLVVELDGSQHYEPDMQSKDAVRTSELEELGIMVLRFSDYDVDKSFEGVCQAIDRAVRERTE